QPPEAGRPEGGHHRWRQPHGRPLRRQCQPVRRFGAVPVLTGDIDGTKKPRFGGAFSFVRSAGRRCSPSPLRRPPPPPSPASGGGGPTPDQPHTAVPAACSPPPAARGARR